MDSDPLVFMSHEVPYMGWEWSLESLSALLLLGGVYRGRARLVGQCEAQGEPIGCRGDGEGVRAHEGHIA